ncbi:MAG: DUF448 domain-containing protein [Parvibaculales bacterium]
MCPPVTNRAHGEEKLAHCVVSGAALPMAQMMRFVVSPQGVLTPDLEHKLSGTTFWVQARYDMVAALSCKMEAGKMEAGQIVPDDLAALVQRRLEEKCLSRLALARKAGQIVLGSTKVAAALAANKVGLLLAAQDGAAGGRKKLAAQARRQNVPLVALFTSAQLSMVLGRDNVIHAAVTSKKWVPQLVFEAKSIADYKMDAPKIEN